MYMYSETGQKPSRLHHMDHLSITNRWPNYHSTALTTFCVLQSHNVDKVRPRTDASTSTSLPPTTLTNTKWIPLSNLRRLHINLPKSKKATCSHEHYKKAALTSRTSVPPSFCTTSPPSGWLHPHVASRLWESLQQKTRRSSRVSSSIWMARFVSTCISLRLGLQGGVKRRGERREDEKIGFLHQHGIEHNYPYPSKERHILPSLCPPSKKKSSL
jgi:hypothetical protein